MKIILSIIFIGFISINIFSQAQKVSVNNQDYFIEKKVVLSDGIIENHYDLKQDIPDGDYIFYFDFEKSKPYISGSIKSGKKNGTWKEYYKSGEIKIESNYKKGEKHGTEKEYYKNGQIKSKCEFKKGIISQNKLYYHKDGTLIK